MTGIFKKIILALIISLLLFSMSRDVEGSNVKALLQSAADNEGIPHALLSAICWVESKHGVDPPPNKDPSYGTCQVMLPTAQQMGYKGGIRGLKKPEVSIKYAAKYIKWQLKRYRGNWWRVTGSYNAGSYRLNKRGTPINLKYILKVMGSLGR